MKIKLITIGVYGFDEASFFQALQKAGVDTFVDLRRRRSVRGAAYAFANAVRLQARLAQAGIPYQHWLNLAPSQATRTVQNQADRAGKTAKRQRSYLDQAFAAAYVAECLAPADAAQVAAQLPADARVVALFCVEKDPAACHRSLVADWLHQKLGWEVNHIVP
ncbi:MAG: DUF488 domain-containing protein [Chloroflexi bacterium]|nr:DUF488 domain-containing protein [Chloroflexota bacterium]